MPDPNLLLYGDNLDWLSDPSEFPDGSVDLIYLDPPFNSEANYNVLFKDVGGTPSAAQVRAFDDTWTWDTKASESFDRLMTDGAVPAATARLMKTFHEFLGHSPMLAYLAQMAIRLVHMRRVLRDTGSLFLHCDPTASHYLKLVLDSIFGPENFANEIVWRRTGAHNTSKRFGPIHDVVLFYKASGAAVFNKVYRPYMKGHVLERFEKQPNGKMKFTSGGNILTGAGATDGESGQTWRGFNPSAKNRHWAIPERSERGMPDAYFKMKTLDRLEALYKAKRIEIIKGQAWPQPVWYLEDIEGQPLQDIWAAQPYTNGTVWGTDDIVDADVAWLGTTTPERLGYPTQKPLGLLKRIILAASEPGAVILDPFCGCGTTIDAVETINRENATEAPRRWIGIDVTHLAINLIKFRLGRFNPPATYEVRGEPVDLAGATQLFKDDAYQFQFWACGLVRARPEGSKGGKKGKKGADHGIDGRRHFVDDNKGPKTILVQVKGGNPSVAQVRDFAGTIGREKAEMGIFVTLHEPTKPMRAEAAKAGFYHPGGNPKIRIPVIQIVTIEELLKPGGTPRQPNGVVLPPDADFERTFKSAKGHDEASLFVKGSE
jgi:DNA modification methylase